MDQMDLSTKQILVELPMTLRELSRRMFHEATLIYTIVEV